MTNKERYHKLCQVEESIPIFSLDWWLDAVCGAENWDVYLIGNGMDIKAALPYSISEKNGKREIHRITLTQNNGIWIKYPKGQGIISKQSYEEKIINEICDFIESLKLARYDQQYHYHFTNYLPFFWRYYSEVTKYTYVIDDTGNLDVVRNAYSSKLKNVLRKAEKNLTVKKIDDLDLFYCVNRMSFERQQIEIPYSYDFFERLYQACQNHLCTELLSVVDETETVQSVAMIVWDKMSVYYLLNGTNPKYKDNQGNALLIDASIQKAHELELKFDFEGSVIKNVNHAFREFGGTPKPYFRISKEFS